MLGAVRTPFAGKHNLRLYFQSKQANGCMGQFPPMPGSGYFRKVAVSQSEFPQWDSEEVTRLSGQNDAFGRQAVVARNAVHDWHMAASRYGSGNLRPDCNQKHPTCGALRG